MSMMLYQILYDKLVCYLYVHLQSELKRDAKYGIVEFQLCPSLLSKDMDNFPLFIKSWRVDVVAVVAVVAV